MGEKGVRRPYSKFTYTLVWQKVGARGWLNRRKALIGKSCSEFEGLVYPPPYPHPDEE